MGLLLIVLVMSVLGGLLHTIQLIWTRAQKDRLSAKYKPGTAAHKINETNLSTKRLVVTVVVTIASSILTTITINQIIRVRGDDAHVIIIPALIMALVAVCLAVVVSYNFYKKN